MLSLSNQDDKLQPGRLTCSSPCGSFCLLVWHEEKRTFLFMWHYPASQFHPPLSKQYLVAVFHVGPLIKFPFR